MRAHYLFIFWNKIAFFSLLPGLPHRSLNSDFSPPPKKKNTAPSMNFALFLLHPKLNHNITSSSFFRHWKSPPPWRPASPSKASLSAPSSPPRSWWRPSAAAESEAGSWWRRAPRPGGPHPSPSPSPWPRWCRSRWWHSGAEGEGPPWCRSPGRGQSSRGAPSCAWHCERKEENWGKMVCLSIEFRKKDPYRVFQIMLRSFFCLGNYKKCHFL